MKFKGRQSENHSKTAYTNKYTTSQRREISYNHRGGIMIRETQKTGERKQS